MPGRPMLGRAELLLLAEWCRRRGMSWLPGRSTDGAPALLLEHRAAVGGEPMLLTLRDAELCLADESGQMIASASDLPALLDALDAGIADPVRDRMRQSLWVPAAFTGVTARAA